MRDKDQILLESVYESKILLSEKIYGNVGWVYHRTSLNPKDSILSREGIKPTANSSALYGKGLYCCYDINVQLSPDFNMEKYGRYLIKGKVNLDGFVILDRDIFEIAQPRENFENYLKRLGIDLEEYKETLPYTSNIAQKIWRKSKMSGANGIIFTGKTDGKVALVWTRQNFIPYQYANTTKRVFDDTIYIRDEEELVWTNLNPNVSHIKRKFDPEYDKDPERETVAEEDTDKIISNKSIFIHHSGTLKLPNLRKLYGGLYSTVSKTVDIPKLEEMDGPLYLPNAIYVNMPKLKKIKKDEIVSLDKVKTFNLDSLEECNAMTIEVAEKISLPQLKRCSRFFWSKNAKEVYLPKLEFCQTIYIDNAEKLVIPRKMLSKVQFNDTIMGTTTVSKKKTKIIHPD